MTVLEVIQRSSEFLTRKGLDSPRLQVELLLAHVLRLPRLQLYLNFERQLADPELQQVRDLVQRRGRREPLQHLVGSVGFCGLDIEVTPAALIPRPETEGLAERAWRFLNADQGTLRETGAGAAPRRVLDIGTGTGCLILAIAAHAPTAACVAVDISPEALDLARRNASRLGLEQRVSFLLSDGPGNLPPGGTFDLIVTNPPYIATEEITTLEPEVRLHDPLPALDGGPDGLAFYRRFAVELRPFLRETGVLMAEFGAGQAAEVQSIFLAAGWKVLEVHRDLAGIERFLVACPG